LNKSKKILFLLKKYLNMDLSYWELKNWFTNIDYTIVGSGVGLQLHYACLKIS
jgi:hypothetical protein